MIGLDSKEAKEIIRAGFAWANWTEEQKKAFKLAYEAIDKAEHLKRQLRKQEMRWDDLKDSVELAQQKAKDDVNQVRTFAWLLGEMEILDGADCESNRQRKE